MGWVTTLIITFLSIIALIATIVVGVITSKKTRTYNIDKNLPIAENTMPELTNGHTQGIELKSVTQKNGNYLVTFLPTSIRYRESIDFQPDIQPIRFVVGKGYRKVLGVGEFDAYRDIVKYEHKNPSELSKKFGDTTFGEILSRDAIVNKVMNRMRSMEREGDKAIAHLIKKNPKGELTRKDFEEAVTLMREMFKSSTINQQEEKK